MRRALLLMSMLMLYTVMAWAQQKQVNGVVVDSQGQPVVAATVVVSGTTRGTTTDATGHFEIAVSPSEKLEVTSIGFLSQTVSVPAGENSLRVTLQNNAKMLQETVVTALGIKRDERKVGYAVSTVTGKEIERASPTNFASALYGKAPGVSISTNPGGATSAVGIQIRGINSLSYQRQPLLVVDGIVVRNGDANNEGYWGGNQLINGNGLLDINPDNIQTINILKGAAASALYGSDAEFGVIVITTKNGHGAKGLGVDVNLSAGIETVAETPDLQTEYGPGYDRVTNMSSFGSDDEGWLHTTVNGQQVEYPIFRAYAQFGPKVDGREVYWWDGKMRPYVSQPNNWKKFYRTGYSTIANVALNNATDKMSYRLSYTRNDYQGIQIGGKDQKNTFNFNSNYKLTDKINVDLVANYINEKTHNRPRQIYYLTNNFGGFFSPVDYMDVYFEKYKTTKGYKYVPYDSNLDPEEKLKYNIRGYDFLDFLWDQLANSFDETTNRLMASVTVNYNIAKGLTFRGRYGTDYTGYFSEQKNRSTQPISFGASGSYGTNTNRYVFNYGDLLLSYEHKLTEQFDLTASVGYQAREEDYRYNSASTRDGLTTENWYSFSASKTTPAQGNSTRSELVKDGLFGILNVGFHDYLFVEGTIRRERSSTLFPGNNTFYYPGVSASFELSNAFQLPDFVTYSKLRAAWGIVGNPPNPYQSNVVYSAGNIEGIPTFYPTASGYGNKDLKNEEKHELEFGWETKLFNDRFGFDVSYYNDKIVNQILNLSTPATIGATSVVVNVGNMRNYGLEVALNGTPVKTGNFRWDTRLNFAFNRNKVVSLMAGLDQLQLTSLDNNSLLIVAQPGKPAGEILGYKRRKDASGNYVINSAGFYDIDFDDQVSMGNIQPKMTGGFINTFSYKGFDLNVLVDFHWGGQVVSQALLYGTGSGLYQNSMFGRDAQHGGLPYYVDGSGSYVQVSSGATAGPAGQKIYHDGMILKGVTADGKPNATLIDAPSFYLNTYNWGSWPGSGSYTTYEGAVFDNNYIKLREISLSYTLPARFTSKIRMKDFTFSVYGRNLFYFYKTLPYMDPEGGVGTFWVQQYSSIGQGNAPTRSVGISIRASF